MPSRDRTVREVRIFLSSPGDVRDERVQALEVLERLRDKAWIRDRIAIRPVAWAKGSGPAMIATLTPQEAINQGLPRPSECDVVVVLFWSRMGTPLPADYKKPDGTGYLSGTEWEYEDARRAAKASGKPIILLYRRTEKVGYSPDDPEYEDKGRQWRHVQQFFSALVGEDGSLSGGYNAYESPSDFRDQFEQHLEAILWTMASESSAAPAVGAQDRETLGPSQWKGSPYPGLLAFTAHETPIFFGRGKEIDDLVQRIHRPDLGLLAVVGASGSGKSSLVSAGLIPRMQALSDTPWTVVSCTPDELGTRNPFATLASALLAHLPARSREPKLAERLEQDPTLFSRMCGGVDARPQDGQAVPQEKRRTLFFLDQFEETFTTVEPRYRPAFIETIVASTKHPTLNVVIAVRSDFYAHCLQSPELALLLKAGTYPLGPPTLRSLRQMITRPADMVGVVFAEGLADMILEDTGTEPGALALMAYTLYELYGLSGQSRKLTTADYEALGGVKGALGKRSEAIFQDLPPQVQEALPGVFRELVEVDERGTATRVRAPLARVATTEAATRLVEAFTEARLLVQGSGSENESYVEVAHEALLRSWARLAGWIEARQADLRLWRQVEQAAREWAASGRRPDYLWSHERLQPFLAAQQKLELHLDDLVRDFVRPESDRLLDELKQAHVPDHRRNSAVARLVEIGETAIPALVESLGYMDRLPTDVEKFLRDFMDRAGARARELARSHDVAQRLAGIRASGVLGTPEDIRVLRGAQSDEDYRIRLAAAKSLHRIDDADARAALVVALDDPHVEVRKLAVNALMYTSHPGFANKLRELATDESAEIRQAVLQVFKYRLEQKDSRVVPPLIRLLRRDHDSPSAEVATLLRAVRDPAFAPALIEALGDVGVSDRPLLIDVLGQIGDPRAAPHVSKLLRDESVDVRSAAAASLGRLRSADACQDLTASLADQNVKVRQNAAASLGQLNCTEASPALRELLDDADAGVRAAAAEALGKLHDTQSGPKLMSLLQDHQARVRPAAALALGEIGWTAASGALTALLDDPSGSIRSAAARALGELGGIPVKKFAQLLLDEDALVRAATARAVGASRDASSIPQLVPLLSDAHRDVRYETIVALAKLGDRSVSDHLVKRLTDDDLVVRRAAADALEKLGDPTIVPALVDLLRHPDPDARSNVLRLLERFGDARIAPVVIAALGDPDWWRSHFAARQVLDKIADKTTLPNLIEALQNQNSSVGSAAGELVAKLGDASTVPALEEALRTDRPEVRSAIATVLGHIGGQQSSAAVMTLLKDESAEVRVSAATALGQMGAQEGASHLALLLKDQDATVRAATVSSLVTMKSQSAVSDIVALLRDPAVDVRKRAALAVGALGAKDALPSIRSALSDPALPVREAALVSLGKLGTSDDVPALASWLDDATDSLRAAAAQALGELRATSALEPLLGKLADSSETVRVAVILALGQVGGASVVPVLLAEVGSDNYTFRSAAEKALSDLRLDRVSPEMRAYMRHENPALRTAATRLVGSTGDLDALPELLEAATGDDWQLRTAAVGTFEHFKGEAAVQRLVELLEGQDSTARQIIVQALGKTGEASAIPHLERLLTDADEQVQAAAVEALGESGDDSLIPMLLQVVEPRRHRLFSPWRRRCGSFARRTSSDVFSSISRVCQPHAP